MFAVDLLVCHSISDTVNITKLTLSKKITETQAEGNIGFRSNLSSFKISVDKQLDLLDLQCDGWKDKLQWQVSLKVTGWEILIYEVFCQKLCNNISKITTTP